MWTMSHVTKLESLWYGHIGLALSDSEKQTQR